MGIKQVDNPKQIFYDKNGIKIKVGDKIKTNIDDQFLDGVIHDQDGKLGLFFKHADYFIQLDKMLDRFFSTVEIIERKKQ
jgi:hypothetical protein